MLINFKLGAKVLFKLNAQVQNLWPESTSRHTEIWSQPDAKEKALLYWRLLNNERRENDPVANLYVTLVDPEIFLDETHGFLPLNFDVNLVYESGRISKSIESLGKPSGSRSR